MGNDSHSLINALDVISSLGLPLPSKPIDYHLDWPKNVADLDMDKLSEHMTYWTGLASYARHFLSKAEVNLSAYKVKLDVEMVNGIYKSNGDYKTMTETKAAIAQSRDIVDLKLRIERQKALVVTLGALLKGYEEKFATISREISRRGIDYDGSR